MNRFLKVMMLLAIAGCTKTDTIAPPAEADNRITEYKIVNVQGDPIYGTVHDADSSITVYLPFYKQLIVLEPEIKVSTGATVQPGTGTLIENLLEVFQKGRDLKYTVTGKSGKKKTYTLKITVQQPALTLKELSSATDVKTYAISTSINFSTISIDLKGTSFHENHDLLKVVLVDEAGKEFPPFNISTTNTNDLNSLNITLTNYLTTPDPMLVALPATGLYKLRVYSYSKKVTTTFPIRINKLP
ncbi:hypothetical protein GFS24_27785 [Chitinophaga sp. SYP-B3965]|uniref:hypothetical protein n=1 Tax=Chitinophaga sp. SYP-B3965 TaxID=2663120 RepID=UPI0012996E65|nr:hypothetical protein [Chitinophaga sp. SYP-B3965]MRG48944.1 hypothetical protein [Chitinophaga sp. SYP-B3965]